MIILLTCTPAHAGRPEGKRWAQGRILVQPRAGLDNARFHRMLGKLMSRSRGRVAGSDVQEVEVPPGWEIGVAKALAADPSIQFAEVDQLVPPETVPDDPRYGSAWHLPMIQAPTAWDTSRGDGVTVAILDTGVDGAHPDLAGKMVPGWNAYDNNDDSSDVQGHGTMVAGTVAAETDNALGVASVAWNAQIMPVRISQPDGWAYWSTIATGLRWAADHGAKVANISYGVTGSATVGSAAQYLRSQGGVVVVAAGNSGSLVATPEDPSMISVSATTSSDTRASWSSYGEYVDLSAPGAGIQTTSRGGGYTSASGTSFSSPCTAGVVALMMAANPTLSPDELESLLVETADDLGPAGWDQNFGSGRVNAAAAVAAAVAAGGLGDTVPPAVAILSPAGGVVSGTLPVDVAAADDVGVARVDLYVNGDLLASDDSAPYAFSVDCAALPYGPNTLTAYAFDLAGNESAPSTVEVTVEEPANLTPIADAGGDQSVGEGASVTLDASNSSDPDGSIASYRWAQLAGTPVSLSDPDAAAPTFVAPAVGLDGQTLTFQLTVTDAGDLSDTDSVLVNVADFNRAPVADAGGDQSVAEGASVTLDASNSSDPDGSIASYRWAQLAGTPVTLSDPDAAAPTFVAPAVGLDGQTLTFQLTVTDAGDLSDTDSVLVNVADFNRAPVADAGGDQSAAEGASVTLDASNSSDPDGSIASYRWAQLAGTPVTLSDPDAVVTTFVAPAVGLDGQTLTFQLTVTDAGDLSDTDSVLVNVADFNRAPVADAGGDQSVAEGATVTLDASNSSDPDGSIASYRWAQLAGTPVTLSAPDAAAPTFVAPAVGLDGQTLTFQLTVTDAGDLSDTDSVLVNVADFNRAPVADAGGDQSVAEGASVTLDASNSSDPDGSISSYRWTQTDGTPVTLSDPDAAVTTFVAPAVGLDGQTLTFQLTVTDAGDLSATDSVLVNVADFNRAPVADAGGDQSVAEGASVTLDASNSSDPDGSISSYRWTQTDGTPVTLSDPDAAVTTFVAPAVGLDGQTLTFQLTVTDAGDLSATDSVLVNVADFNRAPVADAGGDQSAAEGTTVTLDASNSSDPDGSIASYRWAQLAGTPVTLSAPDAAVTTFVAPAVGLDGQTLTFQLTVTDAGDLSATDSVLVNVADFNRAPVADAGGDQSAAEGASVTLDASNSSDPDGTLASYRWTQTGGPSVTLSDPAAALVRFAAPPVGPSGAALTFRLTVTDADDLSATDSVLVNVSDVNLAPIADARANQTVNENAEVTLDASNSADPDGSIAFYRWSQIAGPPVTLSAPGAATPTFDAPPVGPSGAALTFQLTVTDAGGLSATDSVLVNVSDVNLAPIADARANQTVSENAEVTLDASNSADPDGSIAAYRWSQIAGPPVTLSDPDAATPTLLATPGAALTFELTVTDDGGLADSDTVIVNVPGKSTATVTPVEDSGGGSGGGGGGCFLQVLR